MTSSTFNQDPLAGLLAPAASRPSALRTVLTAGCTAATIDIVFAFVFFGALLDITPMRVLQSVATGWYGRAAFEGGAAAAAVGLASHYAILIVAAWLYYTASRGVAVLNQRPIAAGVAFGICVYIAMTFVIVPLSATPTRALTLSVISVGQFLIHPVIGIAIALIVRRAANGRALA